MKKRVLTGSLVLMMAFLLAIPALAAPVQMVDVVPVSVEQIEIEGIGVFSQEMTQIFWRTTSTGQLQFRVWSITNGRWLTDWLNA